MKKLFLVACISGFSTIALSQSVVTDPVGVKLNPKTIQNRTNNSAHSVVRSQKANTTSRPVKQPVVATKPKMVKH